MTGLWSDHDQLWPDHDPPWSVIVNPGLNDHELTTN